VHVRLRPVSVLRREACECPAAAQFFTEYPSLCYVPNATLSRAVNDWADQLIGAAPCSLDI
jgi:hypothetical protein